MKIPPDAEMPVDKFTDYLLVDKEYNDKSKYLAKAGFTAKNYTKLIKEIQLLITNNEATIEKSNVYGTFYRVDGIINGFNNVSIPVTRIWLERKIDNRFQFITLIPGKRG